MKLDPESEGTTRKDMSEPDGYLFILTFYYSHFFIKLRFIF